MNETKRFSLVKPTVNTPFRIDFDWWKQHDTNWHVYLFSYLCPEHLSVFADADQDIRIDTVDPETAEIHTYDGLLHVLMSHCARQPDFVTNNTALVDSVFRVLLSNGNKPMTPAELGAAINRPPETILRTLAGLTVYKGIRPQQK